MEGQIDDDDFDPFADVSMVLRNTGTNAPHYISFSLDRRLLLSHGCGS